MIQLKSNSECCGCAACVQTCPVQCISLREDVEGFVYPDINIEACIDCGKCDKVCPMINTSTPREPINSYAAKNHREQIRLQSSSGGVFMLLSEYVLAKGGVVFGAVFDEQWDVHHVVAQSLGEVARMRGSKYLQSRIEQSFVDAQGFLQQGHEVLFSGTPCQIAALKLFLGRDYDNLLLVDIACHGVPSAKVWREYLNSVSDLSRIESINFRDKRNGWREYNITINAGEQSVSESHIDNIYMQGFIKGFFLRPSCYTCSMKRGRSGSDITLADFWNIRRVKPHFDDNKGVSLLLANTTRAKAVLSQLDMELIEVSPREALYDGSALVSSPSEPSKRAALFAAIDNGVINRLRELLEVPFYTKIIRRVKRILKL